MFRNRLNNLAKRALANVRTTAAEPSSPKDQAASDAPAAQPPTMTAENIRRWLHELDHLDAAGQERMARRGRVKLVLDVLAAIASGNVADPAGAAAALSGIDQNALSGRGGERPRDEVKQKPGPRDTDRMMQRHTRRIAISLPEHRLLYFSTPKVASSTLKATLWRLGVGDPNGTPPEPIYDVRYESPLKPPPELAFPDLLAWANEPQFRRFCFVRNPYSRLLSCYLHKVKGSEGRPSIDTLATRASLSETGSQAEISFAEFIEAIGRQTPMQMNPHWRVQADHLLWGRIGYDFVGRIEDFNTDLDRLGGVLGIDLRPYLFVRDKHKTKASGSIEDYYTPALQERVFKIYEADFKAFGYSTELPPSQPERTA